ncbi:MAG: TetR/AcrR family transcriptional regulator [Micrococcales bacterium]|nr:TetR/AcrR family transcriptional regulator [Micrococcales bacterium]
MGVVTRDDGDRPPAEERILQATIDGLTRLDPAALTLQRICRSAGVTAPTVYYHFGNKDGMIAAAIERLASDWVDMMDAAVSREGDLGLTLAQAVAAWEATITAPNRPIAVFAWATLLMAESSEQSRDALIRVRDRTLLLVTESLTPHMNDEVATRFAGLVIDAVVSSALQYELDRDRQGLRDRLEGLVGLVGASAGVGLS